MLASGNVPVQYSAVQSGFRGTDQTVALMSKLSSGKWGMRSPKIRALAINILRSSGVPEKAYYKEMVALHNWVRDKIRYTRDVFGQETLCPPEEIAFNTQAGDCDDKSMLLAALLGAAGMATRYKVIGVTPRSYSHVYLQARPGPPGTPWISLDPIMKGKPAGWEAPASMVKIAKVFPENSPEEGPMHGLGYIADSRIVSFLEPDPAPQPPPPPYVIMDSFLDTDLPIEAITNNQPAFPQNAYYPEGVGPQPHLTRRFPQLIDKRLPQADVAARIQADEEAAAMDQGDYHPFNGLGNELMGPEQLAAMGSEAVQRQMGPPAANMQVPALVQHPEGIDVMFGRRSLVMRGDKGDRIIYRGLLALNEKPPIRRVQGLEGVQPGGALPGMGVLGGRGMSGPGMGELADLRDAPVASSAAPAPSNGMKYLGAALAIGGLLLLAKRLRKK